MRTLRETIHGRNLAFDWLQAKQLRYQAELTRTGTASPSVLADLAEARRIYETWTVGSEQMRQRRQVVFDRELTRAARDAPRPRLRPKRKRKRARKARPAPQAGVGG